MTDVFKLGVKLFAEQGRIPPLPDFIPVFHRWIRTRATDDLLIDVADYSHVESGPGIVLVAHEGNYSIDCSGKRPGLAYYRKHPTSGTVADRLASILRSALRACRLLEEAPELAGRIRFQGDEVVVFANDRLLAPNTDETFAAVRGNLEELARRVFGNADSVIERERDPKERFSVTIRAPQPRRIETLLAG